MKYIAIATLTAVIMLLSGCSFLEDPFPVENTPSARTTESAHSSSIGAIYSETMAVSSSDGFPFTDFKWGKTFSYSTDATFQHEQNDGAYIYEIYTKDINAKFGINLSYGDMQLSMEHAYTNNGEEYMQSFAFPSEKGITDYYIQTAAAIEVRITEIQDTMIQPMPQYINGSGAQLIGVYMLSERASITIASDDTAGAPIQLILVSATDPGTSVLVDGFDEDSNLMRMIDMPLELEYDGVFALYIAANEDCDWSFTIDMAPDEPSEELIPEDDGAVG